MAEGFLRHLAGDRLEVYSAGIDPTDEVHPCTVEAMSEVGIDIADQYPKGLRTYLGKEFFNYLIIVCVRASDPEHPVSELVEPQRSLWFYKGGRQPHVHLEVSTASIVAGRPPYSELVSLIAERISIQVHVRLSPRRDEVALQRQVRGYPAGEHTVKRSEDVGKALLEARTPEDRILAGVGDTPEN
jgi:Low molecular weight phosphotyrosine protein phosphatase